MDDTAPTNPDEPVEEKAEAESAQTEAEAAEPEPPPDIPLPPPSFEFLVLSLRSQAEMQLGMLHFGEEKDRPKPNLQLARHTIDMMAMLLEKTKGNLSIEETRLLENSLTELRYRCVQISEAPKQE
jgi:hypothetical protein